MCCSGAVLHVAAPRALVFLLINTIVSLHSTSLVNSFLDLNKVQIISTTIWRCEQGVSTVRQHFLFQKTDDKKKRLSRKQWWAYGSEVLIDSDYTQNEQWVRVLWFNICGRRKIACIGAIWRYSSGPYICFLNKCSYVEVVAVLR